MPGTHGMRGEALAQTALQLTRPRFGPCQPVHRHHKKLPHDAACLWTVAAAAGRPYAAAERMCSLANDAAAGLGAAAVHTWL